MNKSLFADRYRGIKNWVRQQNGDLNRRAVRRTARNIMANYNTYFPENQGNAETATPVETSVATTDNSSLNPGVMALFQSTFGNSGSAQTASTATAAPVQVQTPTQVETATQVENPPVVKRIVDGHDFSNMTFSQAFAAARKAGLKNFKWKGELKGTGMASTPEQITAWMRSQGKSDEEINAYLTKKGMKPVGGRLVVEVVQLLRKLKISLEILMEMKQLKTQFLQPICLFQIYLGRINMD